MRQQYLEMTIMLHAWPYIDLRYGKMKLKRPQTSINCVHVIDTSKYNIQLVLAILAQLIR